MMERGSSTYNTNWKHLEDSSFLIVTMMLMIIQSLPSFIESFFYSGHNFVKLSLQTWNWTNIIWNNKEIRIDKKPIYYKKILTPESLTSTISGSIWILMIPSVTFQIKLEKLAFYNGQVFDTQYLIFWKMIVIISIH